jgi:hypothetical protein
LNSADWERVVDVATILAVRPQQIYCSIQSVIAEQDANNIQQYFSAEKRPTLWRVLPALEKLQTAWEKKRDSSRYAIYRDAINDGLSKLNKYYSRFDEKPAYVLALGLFYFYYLLLILISYFI